jgi:predicted nuclease with TOPRIM domain
MSDAPDNDYGLGLKVHEDAYRELERERDEWKAKFIQQNKALGAINAERAESRGLRKAWVELDDKRQDLENQLSAITEQRDRLAEAAHAVWDRWETPLWKDHPPTALVMNKLRDALSAMEGGSDE